MLRPATATIREDVYYTYACRKCSVEATETPILKTERIPPVISGSYASPEAIAHIMVQKFVMASPLYRQEQELNRPASSFPGRPCPTGSSVLPTTG